ncbi:unnamed protein product [Penicillium salamii]|uniref:Protein kinase domain-containing protein n=1 Tax=Penicillium salamii TaxID=1612424 RepID=A0A9W4J1W1_9EURO|nr:unnamed protein product [Penicillium salamii]CAG8039694.1 unnamed protein product [Penicillium salamii]CAG8052177.1 unnamed protein product [Penicillium salamii]CAG8205899.1 unnamed protein product [Penicillium salamii]CAG8322742.1 unnamed protein product [Penicillium salamii]
MHPKCAFLTNIDTSSFQFIHEIASSDSSSIFEVDLDGQKYALKLFHNNGDPGYAENGRDLDRFRCESQAYEKLLDSDACTRGFIPKIYGQLDQIDPADFHPILRHFAQDKYKPRALLLEYLPNAEALNCVNYLEALYHQAVEGMKEIHKAGVHHRDIYPRNILVVREDSEKPRLVWIDFDVATTFTNFGPEQLARCDQEIALVEGFGEALVWDLLLPYIGSPRYSIC